jgi:hypothetical protein
VTRTDQKKPDTLQTQRADDAHNHPGASWPCMAAAPATYRRCLLLPQRQLPAAAGCWLRQGCSRGSLPTCWVPGDSRHCMPPPPCGCLHRTVGTAPGAAKECGNCEPGMLPARGVAWCRCDGPSTTGCRHLVTPKGRLFRCSGHAHPTCRCIELPPGYCQKHRRTQRLNGIHKDFCGGRHPH